MKEIKEIITGCGFLISGVIGVAIGNLQETLYYSTPQGSNFTYHYTYYLFMFFIMAGCVLVVYGLKKGND